MASSIDVEIKRDLDEILPRLKGFFETLGTGGRDLPIGLDVSDISKTTAAIMVENALSLSAEHNRRIQRWAKIYAAKFPASEHFVGRDAQAIREQLAPASGPLRFAGPDTEHGVDEVISQVYEGAPWMKEPLVVFWRMLKKRMHSEGYFGCSPMLLVGAHGTGKSSLARNIAVSAGLHHIEIDAGTGTSAMRIAGVESGWASRQIGEVLRTVIDSRTPNSMIVVNEVDKVGGGMRSSAGTRSSLTDALLPLLEASTAAHFRCPATHLTLDLSSVSWVLTANDITAIDPVLLSRLRVVQIPPLTIEAVILYLETHHASLDPYLLSDLKMAVRRGWSSAITLRHVDRIIAEITGPDVGALRH